MENSKYYWIKLRTDYFDQETIDFLMAQQNGCEYVVLYQMLCLQTANTNGKLINQIGEMIIPFNIEKIARDTKYFDYDTIVVALELYKKLGLIYAEEDGILRITDIDNMVGSETKWAEKKRLYREKQKMLGQKKDNVLEDNRDKILDIRDIDNISSSYINNIENELGLLSSMQVEELYKLKDEYGEELVIEALKECAINNVRTISYLKGILNNWKKANIKSIDGLKNTNKNIPEETIELFDYDWTKDD